jgi:predicted nucleic acid-binding protein
MFTIDTCVWINADSPTEVNHAASREFLDRVAAERIRVIVPTLLRVEVAGTVARMSDDTPRANAISSIPFVQWIALDVTLSESALKLAANQRLRGADAVYAAVALGHGCKLISLDNEHLKRLASIVEVLTPEKALAQIPKRSP